jgi:ribosomal protein L7/L12
MYWLIAMCVVTILVGTLSVQRDRAARTKFHAQHPNGVLVSDLSQKVQELLKNGQRIQALKQFRKDTGLGLKDAKEILDTHTV